MAVSLSVYQSEVRVVATFVLNSVSTEQIKWSEGVFPQQQRRGWVQRDYRESFMTDLITPSWLLCEILTPTERGRCDSYQNPLTLHPSPDFGQRPKLCERHPLQTNRSL